MFNGSLGIWDLAFNACLVIISIWAVGRTEINTTASKSIHDKFRSYLD